MDVVHLATLRREQRPHRELSAVWQEVMARDPWNREAYLQVLGYLSPDECGSAYSSSTCWTPSAAACPPTHPPPPSS